MNILAISDRLPKRDEQNSPFGYQKAVGSHLGKNPYFHIYIFSYVIWIALLEKKLWKTSSLRYVTQIHKSPFQSMVTLCWPGLFICMSQAESVTGKLQEK